MDDRIFPNITFIESDPEAILSELIKGYEQKTGRSLYPADPVRVMLDYLAAIIAQERTIANDAARQNVPHTARGESLDNLCELFKDVQRLPAAYSKTTLRFEISELQSIATIIPAGTRATPDGSIMFATEAEAIIRAGELAADVSAVCTIPGAVGNGFAVGQVAACVDLFPYFKSVTNLTETGGGTDTESDTALYQRMRQSTDSYSTAGSSGAYIYHAKSASSLVEDIRATSPSAGVVDIRVLCKNGKLPDEELLGIISSALNDSRVRPLTDKVVVSAPDIRSFDVDITFYVSADGGMSLADAEATVRAAVDEYIAWQTARIGRDINPDELIYLIKRRGIKRVTVSDPVYVAVGETEAAQLGSCSINNGGYEDE